MIEQRTFCFQRFFKISAKYLYHGPLAPGNTLLSSLSCCCFLPRPPHLYTGHPLPPSNSVTIKLSPRLKLLARAEYLPKLQENFALPAYVEDAQDNDGQNLGRNRSVPPYFQFQFAMVTNYFRIKSRPALMIRRPSLRRRCLPSPSPLRPGVDGHGRLSRVSSHIAK